MPTICPTCGTRNPDDASNCRRCKSPLATEASSVLDSQSVIAGRWRVKHAAPGTPHIFEGEDVQSGQKVFIKALNPSAAMDRSVRSRFLKESKLLHQLDNPHLIQVIDVIEELDTPAMVMANPAGEPLAKLLERKGFLPAPIAFSFTLQMLSALDYLHSQGVVHRNLTASNIHVSTDERSGLPVLKLTDFGVARSIHLASQNEGQTGTLLGMQVSDSVSHLAPTPYMAPETLKDDADSRADIYAIGVIFFELLTGRTPVGHGISDPEAMTKAVLQETPTTLRLLMPTATKDMEDVLNRMLAKNPDNRYIDVSETRAALLTAVQASMVKVPRGAFLRGSDPEKDEAARAEEQPQREISTSAYFIDRLPVSSSQYRQFVEATGRTVHTDWHTHNPEDKPHQPVVFVTWQDAADYAEWAGKRLPTEAEWEKAARGDDGRLYPWGDAEPTETLAQYDTDHLAPVTSHPGGASPHGCLDMAGNAFEWVQDWYHKGYYAAAPASNPPGPSNGKKKVLRGGSFVHAKWAIRCATRGRYAPEERRANHSFRCAWSLDD